MKKLIVSTAMLFALSFTAGMMAQDAKTTKEAGKAKTECCTKKNDKKEGCCSDKSDKKAGEKKSCCSDKKAADKKTTNKKSGDKK